MVTIILYHSQDSIYLYTLFCLHRFKKNHNEYTHTGTRSCKSQQYFL